MDITIKVKPRAKENKVEQEKEKLKISVKAPPEQGKANKEVVGILSKHFSTPRSSIHILKGHKSQNKIVRIKKPPHQDRIKINLSKKHCWTR